MTPSPSPSPSLSRSFVLALALVWLASCTSTPASNDASLQLDEGIALDAYSDRDSGRDATFSNDTGTAPITAAEIRAALGTACTPVTVGLYAPDDGAPETLPICQGPGAVLFWNSDLDVDCDGGRTATCMADPSYLPDTSSTGTDGLPIDAETVPFIVIPLPSSRFTYGDHAIDLGQLALVTYGDRWAFGVFADEGPDNILGEASYAMATTLGIDPDPSTGGIDSGATFVVFTGASARITAIEDHDAAVAAGMPLLNALLGR